MTTPSDLLDGANLPWDVVVSADPDKAKPAVLFIEVRAAVDSSVD